MRAIMTLRAAGRRPFAHAALRLPSATVMRRHVAPAGGGVRGVPHPHRTRTAWATAVASCYPSVPIGVEVLSIRPDPT